MNRDEAAWKIEREIIEKIESVFIESVQNITGVKARAVAIKGSMDSDEIYITVAICGYSLAQKRIQEMK